MPLERQPEYNMDEFDALAQQYGGTVISGGRADKIAALSGEVNAAKEQANIPTRRRFFSELPGAALNVGREIAKVPFALGGSLVDVPRVFAGKEPMQPVNVPGLGEVQTYQRRGADVAASDDTTLGKAARYLGIGSEAVLDVAGAAALKPAARATKGLLGRVADDTVESVVNIASKTKGVFARRAEKRDMDFALDLTSRPVTKKAAEDALSRGSAGFTRPGVFTKGKINPSPQDYKVAEASAPYIRKGASIDENIDSLKEGVAQINLGVREMVANNNIEIQAKELTQFLNKAKRENDLLFAGDSSAEKAYDAVVNEYLKFVSPQPTKNLSVVNYKTGDYRAGPKVVNLVDLFDSRQAFDKTIQSKFPNAFKKDATGQYLDPRDNIRANALLDVRRSVNEFISEQLPKNNPLRSALRKESYMIDAMGRISVKNKGIIGRNKIQILTEQYPILKWVAGGIGLGIFGGGGVGVGATIINSSD